MSQTSPLQRQSDNGQIISHVPDFRYLPCSSYKSPRVCLWEVQKDTKHVSARRNNLDVNDAMSTHIPKTTILDTVEDHNQKQVKIQGFL